MVDRQSYPACLWHNNEPRRATTSSSPGAKHGLHTAKSFLHSEAKQSKTEWRAQHGFSEVIPFSFSSFPRFLSHPVERVLASSLRTPHHHRSSAHDNMAKEARRLKLGRLFCLLTHFRFFSFPFPFFSAGMGEA